MVKRKPVVAPVDLSAVRARIAEDRALLSRESLRQRPTLWSDTRSMEACKRAIAVAAVQGHSVLFVGPEAELAVGLADQAGVGSFAFVVDSAPSTPKAKLELFRVMGRYEIHCEAPLIPERSRAGRPGTTLENVVGLVNAAKLPDEAPLGESPASLLRQFCEEYHPTERERSTVLSVARSCAALNGTVVDVAAVAEACMYWLKRR